MTAAGSFLDWQPANHLCRCQWLNCVKKIHSWLADIWNLRHCHFNTNSELRPENLLPIFGSVNGFSGFAKLDPAAERWKYIKQNRLTFPQQLFLEAHDICCGFTVYTIPTQIISCTVEHRKCEKKKIDFFFQLGSQWYYHSDFYGPSVTGIFLIWWNPYKGFEFLICYKVTHVLFN